MHIRPNTLCTAFMKVFMHIEMYLFSQTIVDVRCYVSVNGRKVQNCRCCLFDIKSFMNTISVPQYLNK